MTTTPTAEPVKLEYEPQDPSPINPWLFVPVLYFMQSVPNILVTETFVSVYKNLGVDNLRITFWTSILALPWTFKLFWGPLVDLNFTKRQWTVAMQVLICGTIGMTAGVVRSQHYFELSIAALFLMATFSATHDIACDGLYLMSLDKSRQAAFSGVMATCSRLGRMFISFVMLFMAGRLEKHGISNGNAWAIALGFAAIIYGAGMLWNLFALPRPIIDRPAAQMAPGENARNIYRTLIVIAAGVSLYFVVSAALQFVGHGLYLASNGNLRTILAKWQMTDADMRRQGLILFANVALQIPLWMLIRALISGSPMGEAFGTYFRQSGFGAILLFIMFYRFGEAMIFKIVPLFLQGKVAEGGMGLSVDEVGTIWGFSGPAGLIAGGLAGGWMISKLGLRRSFWPLVICMHTPNLLYVWVAYERPAQIWLYPVALIEAFGYGFGFAGYFVYLMHVAQRGGGQYRTSHYAIGTGLGALFITLAGILSGILQNAFGYKGFFIAACLFTVPGTLTLLLIPMDDEATKQIKAAGDH